MESHRDKLDPATELRALRPTPRPSFAAELDERAAAGFPRRSPLAGSRLGRFVTRLTAVAPKRMLAPAAGTALAAIAVATVIVATTERGGNPPSSVPGIQLDSRSGALNPTAGSAAPNRDSSGVRLSESPPGTSAEGAAVAPSAVEPLPAPGPYASGVTHRDVERSAEIVLATEASKVRETAGEVFETVHAYHGIVMRSSISDGGEGEAGATFDLLIPSGKLGDAMAAFSAIAEVRSRHESTADVTGPTISLGERQQDARAKVESLLAELAGAETEAEREAAEAKLRSARQRVATLRARLAALQRRTHLSSVSLRIETDGGAGPSNGWGVDDALRDAARILAIAVGVSLVGLAILAPLALICLLAWLAQRTWIRHRRERALG